MNKIKWKNRGLTVLRLLPFLLCIAFILIYLFSGRDVSVEAILHYAPENKWLAAVFLLAIYGIKSLSVFSPIIVLHIAGGFLFPPLEAILVNSVGVIIELTIPYWVGRVSGESSATKLLKKYPRLAEAVAYQSGNAFFLSFFLRVISFLPGDAVSMHLGAIKIPFTKYLFGSLLGIFPGIITSTLIGTSITDPASPMFWVSIILTVAISICSFWFYYFWRRSKKVPEIK